MLAQLPYFNTGLSLALKRARFLGEVGTDWQPASHPVCAGIVFNHLWPCTGHTDITDGWSFDLVLTKLERCKCQTFRSHYVWLICWLKKTGFNSHSWLMCEELRILFIFFSLNQWESHNEAWSFTLNRATHVLCEIVQLYVLSTGGLVCSCTLLLTLM